MKTSKFVLFALVSFLVSCNQNSDCAFTRGIGVYPGRQDEYKGPDIVSGGNQYRNLALFKAVWHSSSYDYNLTGQLVTDGIIAQSAPSYIVMADNNGPIPDKVRETLFDTNGNTGYTCSSEQGSFFIIQFANSEVIADKIHIGAIPAVKSKANVGYNMCVELSDDGENWVEAGAVSTSAMPGLSTGVGLNINKPKRYVNFDVELPEKQKISYVRVSVDSDNASSWRFHTLDLFLEGERLQLISSFDFNSVWMSASDRNESLLVDLGAPAKLDKIMLYWINKAVKGSVECSMDKVRWKKIAELSDSSSQTDELSVNGRGRYVRVNMDESAGGNFMLSELEIYGKGGAIPSPREASAPCENTYELSGGNWKLQRSSEVSDDGETLSSVGYDFKSWPVATVPGTVAASYFNNGSIPDIRYDNDQRQISDSYFYSDFWYRDEFVIPSDYAGKSLELNFDGINWKADIYMNGSYVGKIESGYMRGRFDVTELAKPGSENALAVLIHRNEYPGIVKEKTLYHGDQNGGQLGYDNPTYHASIGWDWIPTVRGRDIGIWNDVYFTACGAVSIEDCFVNPDLPLPSIEYADIHSSVILENRTDAMRSGTVTIDFGGVRTEKEVCLSPGERRDISLDDIRISDPRLWWPVGYGSPELYDVTVTAEFDGVVSDSKSFKSGIREMSYDTTDDILNLYINGKRFVPLGGNWGYPEIYLNYRKREYDTAVRYHADMNFNMIRDWVGQTGDDEFYEACDRYGVMVWQDFWLANPSDGPDPADNEIFLSTAEDYIKRIRNHPSIALYVGRNEGVPPVELDLSLREKVARLHPGIFYIPDSAAGTVSGRGPYGAVPVKDYFTMQSGIDKFHSERGMPCLMSPESMSATFSEDNHWPQNDIWGQHDYHKFAIDYNRMVEDMFGKPDDMESFANAAQWINYNGYRAMYESRGVNRMGLLIWMSHSAWPSLTWQTYDYYFEPTAAYFGAKKACAPVHIQWNPSSDKAEVVNYCKEGLENLDVMLSVIDYDGTIISTKEISIDSPCDSTVPVELPEFKLSDVGDVYYYKMSLFDGDSLLADNFYWISKNDGDYSMLKELPSPKLDSKTHIVNSGDEIVLEIMVENNGNIPAPMIRLKLIGATDRERILPVMYSDNYFSLMPGENKIVTISYIEEDGRGQRPVVEILSI